MNFDSKSSSFEIKSFFVKGFITKKNLRRGQNAPSLVSIKIKQMFLQHCFNDDIILQRSSSNNFLDFVQLQAK